MALTTTTCQHQYSPPLHSSHRVRMLNVAVNAPQTLRSPPDGIQGFGRVLLDSVLNVRGTVSLYVEDAITIKHDVVHSYIIDMSDIDSSEYEGDMKASQPVR